MKNQAAKMISDFSVQIKRVQSHMDAWLDHLQTTIGIQLQKILEYMQRGDTKKEKLDYKKLEE